MSSKTSAPPLVLPKQCGAYYGGAWHASRSGRIVATHSPGTGESLAEVAHCSGDDVAAAVEAAGEASGHGAMLHLSSAPGCCARLPASSAPAPKSWR